MRPTNSSVLRLSVTRFMAYDGSAGDGSGSEGLGVGARGRDPGIEIDAEGAADVRASDSILLVVASEMQRQANAIL